VQTYVIDTMLECGRKLQNWSGAAMENVNGKLDLPTDICEWVSPLSLLSWVREESGKLNGATPGPANASALREVLAFAYCRGIFDSEEILRACQSSAELKELSHGSISNSEELRVTRHRGRGLLVTAIVRLLTRAVCEKCDVAPAELEPELKRRLHENAVQRLDNAILIDRVV